ncbi:MAG TPA: AMP-binding protein, partial [Hyphomicrobiaceae bacterium]|nr:AMP-binding protein [Hyphomicrobiaceae bacterium]
YRGLIDEVSRTANALADLGVRPGDRVTAQVEKSIGNILLYLATLKVGATYNPLNTAYTAAELEYFIGDAEPALLVLPKERLDKLAAVARKAG